MKNMPRILYFKEVKPETFKKIESDINSIIKEHFPDGVRLFDCTGEMCGVIDEIEICNHYQACMTADCKGKFVHGSDIRVYHSEVLMYLLLRGDELISLMDGTNIQ
jgi:hypothetical protein